MEKDPKIEAFTKLHELILFYSEYRDRPVEKDFDFFAEVKACCEVLDLDYGELKKEFQLT